jgi:hypothetical protein
VVLEEGAEYVVTSQVSPRPDSHRLRRAGSEETGSVLNLTGIIANLQEDDSRSEMNRVSFAIEEDSLQIQTERTLAVSLRGVTANYVPNCRVVIVDD